MKTSDFLLEVSLDEIEFDASTLTLGDLVETGDSGVYEAAVTLSGTATVIISIPKAKDES